MTAATTYKVFEAAADAGVGAGVWTLLLQSSPQQTTVAQVGEWIHLVGYVVALFVSCVMLYKHKGDAKELVKFILELLKSK